MTLAYSMQDWFFRIAFAPSCGGEGDGNPIAEAHNVLLSSDFDVVINSKWQPTENELRAVLMHECAHAVEQFIRSRYPRKLHDEREQGDAG